MSKIYGELGCTIRETRENKGLTIEQAAAETELSAERWRQIEAGVPCEDPDQELMEYLQICNALSVSISDIFDPSLKTNQRQIMESLDTEQKKQFLAVAKEMIQAIKEK